VSGGASSASGRTRAERWLATGFLAPALIVLSVVTLFPVIRVLLLSLEWRIPVFGVAEFVGIQHYRFLAGDTAFWNATRVTIVFTLVSVTLEVLLGLGAALALRHQRRYRAAAIGLLLLPWCLPGVVTARMWEWVYHPTAGLASRVLQPLFGAEANWLGDPATALPALIVADVWRTMPFIALLAYARLLSISPDLYEAAAVDGAGPAAAFWTLTLPLVAPVLLVATLFRTLDALRAFDLMFVLTGGGPAATTETLTVYAYRSLFQMLQLGFGSAVAVIVFALVVVAAGAYLRSLERAEAR
jgi:multiple sugar transport system permease protein